jgi:AbrB family looped-hinge helix DNA binding protein
LKILGWYYSYHGGNTVKITTKGQVTIPQELRQKYKLESGAEVDFVDEDGRIGLRVVKRSEPVARRLVGRGDVHMSTDEILGLTRAD